VGAAISRLARRTRPAAHPHKPDKIDFPRTANETSTMRVSFFCRMTIALLVFAGGGFAADQTLPSIEVPATGAASPDAPFMIFLSGDGRMGGIRARNLQARGRSRLGRRGVDMRKYLWTPRTPDETAQAIGDAIRRYDARWHRQRIIIAGFSRGADIAPFVINRLPAELRARVEVAILLSPGRAADFEFRWGDFFRPPKPGAELLVSTEIRRLRIPWLILRGRDDDQAIPLPIAEANPKWSVTLPGDHHLGRDYPTIAGLVLAAHSAALKEKSGESVSPGKSP